MERCWLDVPFAEKDAAKAAGARWDATAKRWFDPAPGTPGLAAWVPFPALLPGEDRGFGSGLFVDLVPKSCWFTNVRSGVNDRDWDKLRRTVYARAGHRCEACGAGKGVANKIWLEAHERWDYDPDTRTQHLRRLVCLCTRCHQATHFGYAQISNTDAAALTHLAQVNNWTRTEAEDHVEHAFTIWQRRSRIKWTLDLSILTTAGIRLADTRRPASRRGSGR